MPAIAAGLHDSVRDDVGDRHAGVAEDRQADPERRLQADHARWRLVEWLLLVGGRVRGMVGGDGVDRPVDDAATSASMSAFVRSGGLTLKRAS